MSGKYTLDLKGSGTLCCMDIATQEQRHNTKERYRSPYVLELFFSVWSWILVGMEADSVLAVRLFEVRVVDVRFHAQLEEPV